MVKKSVVNGTNNAIVIEGPISRDEVEEGYVYQKDIEKQKRGEGFGCLSRACFHR
jgi:hypothetical protein